MDLSYIPQYHYKRIEDITKEDILSWGVEGIGLDIDNTICYDATTKFVGNSRQWVEEIKKAGIPLIIVSNANRSRALKIGKMLSLPYVGLAKKPKTDGFFKAAQMLGLDVKNMAFIGDQIFSDIKGANDAGGVSVYVEPPAKEIVFFFFYRIRRLMERPHIKNMLCFEEKTGVKNKVRER